MGSYINRAKTTIEKIMNKLLSPEGGTDTTGRTIKFAFVGYRDHPP